MASFVEDVCLPALLQAQHGDGGWGYRVQSASRVEPTCWVLLALARHADSAQAAEAIRRGCGWLCNSQLADGSWPASADQRQGSWTTALACLALQGLTGADAELNKGLIWICRQLPGEGTLWRRILRKVRQEENISRQNDSYRGWSWTPGTSSWVEPTAYALILLDNTPSPQRPKLTERRCRLAEAMLYDRMCPGGGWNTGNPMVYGVPGEPQIGPTAWALLALRNHRERPENQQSLDWLEGHAPKAQGPSSQALSHMCLEAHRRPVAPLEPALREFHAKSEFLTNLQVLALSTLALGPVPAWLRANEESNG